MPNAHFAYVLGRASSRVSVHGIGRASRVVWNRGSSAHGISRRLYPSFPFVLDSIPQQVADSIRSLCERFHPRHGRDFARPPPCFFFCSTACKRASARSSFSDDFVFFFKKYFREFKKTGKNLDRKRFETYNEISPRWPHILIWRNRS